MDGMGSVVLVMSVDVKLAGPSPCIEAGDGFLEKTFLKKGFISLMIKAKRKVLVSRLHKLRSTFQNDTQTGNS